mmetsp:Transcript_9061/g.27230  ORF Transcript_9061/g.27230 Transcript_9061/m.27230 type:complete len:257 (+) Transcript_9061:50-820(+)
MMAQPSTIRSTPPETAVLDTQKNIYMQNSIVKRRKKSSSTGAKVYACEVEACNRVFENRQARKEHGRTHSGHTPYECPFLGCKRKFKWRSSLASHKKTHTSTVPAEGNMTTTATTASVTSAISSEGASNSLGSNLPSSIEKNNASSVFPFKGDNTRSRTELGNDGMILASIREAHPCFEKVDSASRQHLGSVASLVRASDFLYNRAPIVSSRSPDRSLPSFPRQLLQNLSFAGKPMLSCLSAGSTPGIGTQSHTFQ